MVLAGSLGRFAQALGGASGRRRQREAEVECFERVNDHAQRGRLARAGSAGQDRDFVRQRRPHRPLLLIGQRRRCFLRRGRPGTPSSRAVSQLVDDRRRHHRQIAQALRRADLRADSRAADKSLRPSRRPRCVSVSLIRSVGEQFAAQDFLDALRVVDGEHLGALVDQHRRAAHRHALLSPTG